MKFIILAIFIVINLSACTDTVDEKIKKAKPISILRDSIVTGIEGSAGESVRVPIETVGNPLGYLEYLPKDFKGDSSNIPIIIYWNGQNDGAGDGDQELKRLTNQGLTKLIDEGQHFPAIILSVMLPYKAWKYMDIDPFIEFVFVKYGSYLGKRKVIVSGFSAGGGLSMRYVTEKPEKVRAVVVVAPAMPFISEKPSDERLAVPTWIFHNDGDDVVSSDRSIDWYDKVSKYSDLHRLTIYDSDSHYAWREAYEDEELWKWLLSLD